MRKARSLLTAVFFVLGLATSAQGVPIVYFGEDLAPGGAVPAGGDAETARNAFLSALSGVGTADFESLADGANAPFNLSFPASSGSITATLSGGGSFICGPITCPPPAAGEFATSGSQWVATQSGFNLAFSDPISAFGFYGTDVGDFGGQLILTLTDGSVIDLIVPNTISGPNGTLLFYGFIDPTNSYTNIAFGNTSTSDFFGFDDMVIGDSGQVTPIPEPGAALAFAFGSLVVGLALRRRA